MKFLIVSNAPLIIKQGNFFAYSPYAKEMGIWAKYADEVAFCCPKWEKENDLFVSEVPFFIHKNFWLSDFNVKSVKNLFKAFFQIVYNFFFLFRAMIWADHIHLRCPGNVGLLASIVQVFFPEKKKTTKYAGNWNPKSKQPWSYRLQKWILSNTFLTHNMQVLVYGEWPNQSKNIKPFFTASYSNNEKDFQNYREEYLTNVSEKNLERWKPIRCLFVGALSAGKEPLYSVQLIQKIDQKGYKVELDIYGEGALKKELLEYIKFNSLENKVNLKGNQSAEVIKKAFQSAHFLILPSKSEGWPKVVAEAMFWGCIPVVTPVSCVPYMLNHGKRGIIMNKNLEDDSKQILDLISEQERYEQMSLRAMQWSQNYTLEYFEEEIKKLI